MSAPRPIEIAEIKYRSGKVQFRYGHYLSDDGKRWIRHGPFREFHENEQLASEGEYDNGLATGLWRDYHENGQVAAEGYYVDGVEDGVWQFWKADGKEEETIIYRDGVEMES